VRQLGRMSGMLEEQEPDRRQASSENEVFKMSVRSTVDSGVISLDLSYK